MLQPVSTAQLLDDCRAQRQQVRSRHSQLPPARPAPSSAFSEPSGSSSRIVSPDDGQIFRARDHPRWKALHSDHLDPQQPSHASPNSRLTPRTAPTTDGHRAFGPNYVDQEQTLRNDYSQHFVDTLAGELPGNAVRNPHQATRFDEYPKLKRLVQVKDSLVTLTAHPPTFLRADLKASLLSYQNNASRRFRPNHHADPARPQPQGEQSSLALAASASGTQTPQPVQKGDDASGSAPELTFSRSAQTAVQRDAGTVVRSDFHLGSLMPVKYDVVLIDPPLESYEWECTPDAGKHSGGTWTWDEIAALPVPQVAAKESFVFLWVGSGAGDGLERGREVLSRWGYRRCEDIVWVRTNPGNSLGGSTDKVQPSTSSVLSRCVQHCLMGIRGTVRRSTDTRFVHCNIDTDVILWPGEGGHGAGVEGPDQPTIKDNGTSKATGSDRPVAVPDMKSKPPEMYDLIENFCLGTRRLELFGRNRNLRRGWLTIGLEVGPGQSGWPIDNVVPLPKVGLELLEQQQRYGDQYGGADVTLSQRNHLERLKKAIEYEKLVYDLHFGVDRPGCELRDRINLIPFSEEGESLRPKSPPPRGGARGGGVMGLGPGQRFIAPGAIGFPVLGAHGGGPMGYTATTGMPSGLSANPSLRGAMQDLTGVMGAEGGIVTSAVGQGPAGLTGAASMYGRAQGGGAGLSGLGAGGPRTVSVPSGSDTLSGPQASVVKAKAAAQAAASISASTQ